MNSDNAKFLHVCELFEELSVVTSSATLKRTHLDGDAGSSLYLTKESKKQIHSIISKWFTQFNSGSLLSIFRLLVPEEDVERVYYLKEKRLSQLLVSVLGFENSSRSNVLLKWNESETDFGQEHVIDPIVTISQVDAGLTALSEIGKSSQGKDLKGLQRALSEIYLSMTSLEIKWITRIILKNLLLSIEPKFYFDAFHGWMWKVYLMKNDLGKTCKVIAEMIKEGYTCSNQFSQSTPFASVARKYFQSELGTSIAIMECGRGKGIDHVAKEMKGKVCYVETKFDGERLQAHYNSSWSEPFRIFSKSGRNSTFNRRLCQKQLLDSLQGSNVKDCIIEGELLIFNETNNAIEAFGTVQDLGRKEFRDKGILLGRRHFLVILYDLLYLNGECLMRRPLNERKRLLSLNFKEIMNYVHISPVSVLDFRQSWYPTLETLRQLYMECLDRREEGLIIKKADSLYLPGDRTNWWKLKKDYIEGYGDSADFAIVGAVKSKNSGGMFDTFIAACLTNKADLENDPLTQPNFQAIFTVSLGLTRAELELLQAVLEARKELNLAGLGYDCQFAKGFKVDDYGCCWLREPLVFELLGSGFIKERGMWCYSLRFPRIRRIKMNQTFMDCLTFNELQELGRESISTVVKDTDHAKQIDTAVYDSKSVQKRVRFVFDEQPKAERLLKSDHFIVISRSISVSEREKMYKWFDDRGFELIWSLEAALEYSPRALIYITNLVQDHLNHQKIKSIVFVDSNKPLSASIHIEEPLRLMSHHNFGKIQTVPPLGDFLDIVLSKTQRKTPTVIHKGYAIIRIRNFYMRKVKFTRDTFDEKLGAILQDFPRIEDIHPFYGDLLNVLYDKDHYKLALGQINTARHMIDNVARDYVKLLKYGDSLYRCKQLKRAALGRMATIMKRQKDTLLYLEQVRQHLSRLPSIDPNTRTLLLCGYPNVGKSSFMNKLTRANVDVQPYAFTTKSLFVGHMDYKYLRWQVIDTPGILDHPLEERNTIEMQSITAMAHIRACILFFLDLSESCGYTIVQQVKLFESLRPLFANKPIMIVCNKADLMRPNQLSPEDFAILQGLLDQGIQMAESSCVTEEGVMNVRNSACESLLNQRVEVKMRSQKITDVLNKLHLAAPTIRDERSRPAFIPEAVLKKRAEGYSAPERRLARDIEAENGGAGVYNVNLKENYLLANPEWKFDVIPEIMDGKNIADFIDPEIEEKLRRLEEEEEQFEAVGAYDFAHEKPQSEQERAFKSTLKKIRQVKKLRHLEHTAKTNLNSRPVLVDRIKRNVKRTSLKTEDRSDEHVDDYDSSTVINSKRQRTEMSVNRSQVRGKSVQVRDRSVAGLRAGTDDLAKTTNIHRLDQRKKNMNSRRGEADRRVEESKPKHLFSGKRTSGTNDRR